MRTTKSQEQTHQDHIADRGHVAMSYHNMVHKPILIAKAMTISEAKAALDKERTKLQRFPAWDESKVTSKAEVLRQAISESKKIILPHKWTCLISRAPNLRKSSKSTVEEWYCEGRFWELRRVYGARRFSVTYDGGKSLDTLFQEYRAVVDKQPMPWAHTHTSRSKTHQNIFINRKRIAQRFGLDYCKQEDHTVGTQLTIQYHRWSAIFTITHRLDFLGTENWWDFSVVSVSIPCAQFP